MELYPLLAQLEPEIIDEAGAVLARAHVVHYELVGKVLTHHRLEDLYAVLLEALRTRDLTGMGRYAEQVASDRFGEGFGIAEVQDAFNVLEQAIWRRLVDALPASDLPEALALLSSVMGFGKDELSRTYVALAAQRHARSVDVGALLAGAGS
jgi:hypothetical protein